jgi:outer membrane protein assembly factor BamB
MKQSSFTSLALMALMSPWGAWAQDWPEFRGPSGDGHSPAKQLPLQWSESKNLLWKKEIPGIGWSSPIVVAGKVYLTTAVVTKGDEESAKADRSLRALCIDARTQATVWDVEVFPQDGAQAPASIHRKNSHASPTPIFREGKLYVHFGHQGTACLQAGDGKILWTNRTITYAPQHGNGGTPVLEGNRLIFSCDGREKPFIIALDAATGQMAWRFPRPTQAQRKFAFSTPAVFTINGKRQVISPGADMVNALDPATGKEIWSVSYEGYSIVPKPIFGHGMVYICTSFDTPDVLAIRPTGLGDITKTHVAWELDQARRTPKTCSMILDGELLYWVSDNGMACCAEAKTGAEVWMERIGGEYSASPIVAGEHLYFLDERGKTTILKTGRTFAKVGENKLDAGRTYASPAASDGTLYLRGEKALYAIRQEEVRKPL